MLAYPITSIFRTRDGLLPAFNLCPNIQGIHQLSKPVFILSGNRTVIPVRTVQVLGKTRGYVSVGTYGYYVLHHSQERKINIKKLAVRGNFSLRDTHTLGVTKDVLITNVIKSLVSLYTQNGRTQSLVSRIVKNYPQWEDFIPPDIHKNYNEVDTTFINYSVENYYMSLYLFLKLSFILKKVKLKSNFFIFRLTSSWWRDYYDIICKSLNLLPLVSQKSITSGIVEWRFKKTDLIYLVKLLIKKLQIKTVDRLMTLVSLFSETDVTFSTGGELKLENFKETKLSTRKLKEFRVEKVYDCSTYFIVLEPDNPYVRNRPIEVNAIYPIL